MILQIITSSCFNFVCIVFDIFRPLLKNFNERDHGLSFQMLKLIYPLEREF